MELRLCRAHHRGRRHGKQAQQQERPADRHGGKAPGSGGKSQLRAWEPRGPVSVHYAPMKPARAHVPLGCTRTQGTIISSAIAVLGAGAANYLRIDT